jgi:hypothetical protein
LCESSHKGTNETRASSLELFFVNIDTAVQDIEPPPKELGKNKGAQDSKEVAIDLGLFSGLEIAALHECGTIMCQQREQH